MTRDSLRRGPVSYLGWTLGGGLTPDAIKRFYAWYATEEATDREFSIRMRRDRHAADGDEAAINQALALARGKIFLGTWRDGEEYVCDPTPNTKVSTPLIRDLILRGLHRLYEDGFNSAGVQVDLQGVAIDLGVTQDLVLRAAEHLRDQGLVQGYGTFDRDIHTGDFWITAEGVAEIEARQVPVETFLEAVYTEILGRLLSVDTRLADDLEALRGAVAQVGQSRNELVGYGARVRDFVEELTQQLYDRSAISSPIERSKTKNKVAALTAKAASDTSRDHVRALAEVVETHWRHLNDVQQKVVHAGTVEAQRLFVYVLLFVADLFDVIDSASE